MTVASIKFQFSASGANPPIQVGHQLIAQVGALDASGHSIVWPADMTTPSWSIDNADATLSPSADGKSCTVTGASPGVCNITVTSDEGVNHFVYTSSATISP